MVLLSYMDALPEWDGMDRVTPLAQRISTKDFWVSDSYEHHSRFLKENSRYAQCFALSPDFNFQFSTFNFPYARAI